MIVQILAPTLWNTGTAVYNARLVVHLHFTKISPVALITTAAMRPMTAIATKIGSKLTRGYATVTATVILTKTIATRDRVRDAEIRTMITETRRRMTTVAAGA